MQQNTIHFQKNRFDFSENVAMELANFAKKHQYDDRCTFKEEWNKWIEMPDMAEKIDREIDRMRNDGFEGDVLDKLFKSARYYHRKKSNVCASLSEDPPTEKRIKFSRFRKPFLELIDNNILQQIREEIQLIAPGEQFCAISQADAYIRFCKTNIPEILREFTELKAIHGYIPPSISEKLKKTFKNRFYNVRSTNFQ